MKIEENENEQIVMNMFRERAKGITRMTEEEWEQLDWKDTEKEDDPKTYKKWKKDKKYVDDWIKDVIRPIKSTKTCKQYRSAVRIFFNWNLEENEGIPLYKLKKRVFLKYRNYLLEDCMLASNSIKLKKNALSSFFNFIEQYISEEDISYETFRNPLRNLKWDLDSNKVYDKKPISYEEFIKVQDYILNFMGDKLMYSIFTCMFYTGNRIGEIVQVKTSHCDLEVPQGSKLIETPDYIRGKGKGKSGKPLKLKLSQRSLDAMNFWKDKRGKELEKEEFLFVRKLKNGSPSVIKDEDIRDFFKDHITPFLKRRISPHNMRASFATYLLEQGVDLSVVKGLLSHESIETTSHFYDLRDKNKLANDALKNINF